MGGNSSTHVPVTYERCEHIEGPFYHVTKSALEVGDELRKLGEPRPGAQGEGRAAHDSGDLDHP